MLQATVSYGLAFDHFTFEQNGFARAEVEARPTVGTVEIFMERCPVPNSSQFVPFALMPDTPGKSWRRIRVNKLTVAIQPAT